MEQLGVLQKANTKKMVVMVGVGRMMPLCSWLLALFYPAKRPGLSFLSLSRSLFSNTLPYYPTKVPTALTKRLTDGMVVGY